MKIAIQSGLEGIKRQLEGMGYFVVDYADGGIGANINIIHNVDEAYEEIDPVTYMKSGTSDVMILDASKLSEEDVVRYVSKYHERFSS